MPERHSDGSSGSSSSSSSSGSSWSSSSNSSWSSSSSYRHYGDDGPSSPEQQVLGWIVFGIIVVIFAIFWIGEQIGKANEAREHANATATTEAITAKDLAEMHAALDGRIVEWNKVTDQTVHHVSASDAGLDDGNTKEVLYGYCQADQFYVYVLELSRPGGLFVDTEGYAYTPDSYPTSCHPEGFIISSDDNVGGGWHFITLMSSGATYAAQTPVPQTRTPRPTRTPESKQ